MFNQIQKYGAYIFLLNNILFSFYGFYEIGTNIFLILTSLFLIITLLNPVFIKNIIFNRSFNVYYSFILINITYYLFFDFGDFESFKFLSARTVQFLLFISTIYFTHETFKLELIKILKITCVSCVGLSLVFNFPDLNERYYGVFFNPNEFSIIMVYGFSLFVFKKSKSLFDFFIIFLFVFLILLSGSRAALLGVFISLFLNFKFSRITIFSSFSLILFIYFFRDLPAVFRFFNEDLFYNRKFEMIYAFDTFYNEFWTGNGLKNYAYIDEKVISSFDNKIDFGAHNGYLSILVQYGFIFSLAYFFVFIKYTYRAIKYLRLKMKSDSNYKFYFFVIIYTLVNSLFENSLTGINFFQGSLFWLVLGFVCYDLNNKKIEQ